MACEWCHAAPGEHKRACIAVRTHATAKAQWRAGFEDGKRGDSPFDDQPCYLLGWIKGRLKWAWLAGR